ncbi:MAG: hypothetical protein ACKO24_06865 [Leptolyngbyaceae cyanobacterium]
MPLDIVLTAIQLLPAQPEAADLRKIHHLAAATETPIQEVSYIIKLYTGSSLPQNSLGVELYVGNQPIRQYFQFKNGIYFKVNNPDQLAALQGQEVRFRRPGLDQFVNTGIQVPIMEAGDRRSLLEPAAQLPSQAEVLQE